MYIYTYIYMHIHIHIHIYICVYIYICIYMSYAIPNQNPSFADPFKNRPPWLGCVDALHGDDAPWRGAMPRCSWHGSCSWSGCATGVYPLPGLDGKVPIIVIIIPIITIIIPIIILIPIIIVIIILLLELHFMIRFSGKVKPMEPPYLEMVSTCFYHQFRQLMMTFMG